MELNEIFDIITKRLDAIDNLIHALEERQNSLERALFDDIITPAKNAMEEMDYNNGLNSFKEKYPQLDSYTSKFAPMMEEGFDFPKTTYDNYREYENGDESEKITEEEYVNQAVANADSLLESIKSATSDDVATDEEIDNADKVEVTIEKDENGEAEVTDVKTETEKETVDESESDESVDEEDELKKIKQSYKGPLNI